VVAAEFHHRDHHRFTADDVAVAAAAAARASAWLLTTEKDDARLVGNDVPRHVLRIELRFLGEQPAPAELLL
jgi:tetraacyldisaccharide-1-P 4'-kinase